MATALTAMIMKFQIAIQTSKHPHSSLDQPDENPGITTPQFPIFTDQNNSKVLTPLQISTDLRLKPARKNTSTLIQIHSELIQNQ